MRTPTVGVEEEYLLVDPRTGRTRADAHEVLRRARAEADKGMDGELQAAMLETGTAVCGTLTDARRELERRRSLLARAAADVGAVVLATGTHPTAEPRDVPLAEGERYARMVQAFGPLIDDALVCGCHVHVAVPDRAAGVVAIDRIQPWLPLLLAVSANSPLWRGQDTGYASWRSQVWNRFPTAGATSPFRSEEAYDDRSAALLATGAALDEGMLYFAARLSAKYPTVEVRVADVCQTVDDALLVAGLARALVVTALDPARPAPELPVDLLRSASWVASRHGLSGPLVDPLSGRTRPATEVLELLVAHVRDALEETGDLELVQEGVERLRREGTGADRQRAAFARGGASGVRDLVAVG